MNKAMQGTDTANIDKVVKRRKEKQQQIYLGGGEWQNN
jgi:hypothetical protein